MKASLFRTGLGLAAALFAASSRADMSTISSAAARPDDKSRQALVAIFGNVVNNPLQGMGPQDTVIASIFQVTNGALLVVGGFIVVYMFVRKLMQTAHDGTAFDQRQHALWGPIRILWGVVSLVPTPSGWCLAQLLLLWGASIMGVGIANLGVDSAVSAFSSGTSMVLQPVMPSTVGLAHNLFEANLCMHGINAGLTQAQASGALVSADAFVQMTATPTGFALKNSSFVCGGSDLNDSIETQPASTNWFSSTISTQTLRDAHLQALQTMEASLDASALAFVTAVVARQSDLNATLPDAETAIQNAAQQYESTVNVAAGTKQGDIAALSAQLSTSLSASGWWTLGAWYQTFAQANTKLSDAVSAMASVYGMSSEGDPSMLQVYSTSMAAYKAQEAGSTYTPPIGTSSTGTYSHGAAGSDASNVMGSIFSAPGQRLVNAMIDMNASAANQGQLNPLIKMKNLGDYTLGTAEAGLATYVAVKAIARVKDGLNPLGVAARVANAVSGIGDVLQGTLDAMTPFIIMLIVTLFLLGGTLSVYLPMVPLVVWFGAACNWLVIVGEAVIAAALWSLTFLIGEGDGIGGRSAQGWMLLVDVMLRPVFMVSGFFLGGAFLIAGGTLLNQLFGIGVANSQFDSTTGLVSVIFFLLLYCSMAINLVHHCFNLIFTVPDKAIGLLGNVANSMFGRDGTDHARQQFGVFNNRIDSMTNRLGMGGQGRPGASRPGNGMQA